MRELLSKFAVFRQKRVSTVAITTAVLALEERIPAGPS